MSTFVLKIYVFCEIWRILVSSTISMTVQTVPSGISARKTKINGSRFDFRFAFLPMKTDQRVPVIS